jgi:hypothetical protein
MDTIVKAVNAEASKQQMIDLQKQYGLTPEQVTSIIKAAGATTAAAQVKALRDYINGLKSKTVTVTYNLRQTGSAPGHVDFATAEGSIWGNGVRKMGIGGFAPGIYMGQRIKFAERGDEAYIPMRADMRRRAEKLLAMVARTFGGAFVKYNQSGLVKMAQGMAPSVIGTPISSPQQLAFEVPGAGRSLVVNNHVYYPKKEKTSDGLQSSIGRMAAMGIFGQDD